MDVGNRKHRSSSSNDKALGRIHVENLNRPLLFRDKGGPAQYGVGLRRAIERDWLKRHESGTFDTFPQAGAEPFAETEAGMQDYLKHLEKLRTDAAECRLICDLATEPAKREMFDRLAAHLSTLADQVEAAMRRQKSVP